MNVRYFPFSPGIGWKMKHGKYVVPDINLDVWNKAINSKNIVVVSYGGLIESYFSLCYLEMLNYITPNSKIYWCGNTKFNPIVHLNGIAKTEAYCPKEILSRYPTPLFIDKINNIYFNCLNNYKVVKPYYGGKGYIDKSLISKQLLRNSALPWNIQYIPKFRNINFPSKEFLNWSRLVKLDLNKPYVCFFYDLGLSEHKISTIKWNETQIKSFAAMLKQQGISTLMFTKNPSRFIGSALYCFSSINFDSIIYLLEKAQAVLSDEVDFLFLAMILSKTSKIITRKTNRKLSLKLNSEFLNIQRNNILVRKNPTPYDVFNIINSNDKI